MRRVNGRRCFDGWFGGVTARGHRRRQPLAARVCWPTEALRGRSRHRQGPFHGSLASASWTHLVVFPALSGHRPDVQGSVLVAIAATVVVVIVPVLVSIRES